MKQQGHKWYQPKRFHWAVCAWCGLIALKNEATAKLMKRFCPGGDE